MGGVDEGLWVMNKNKDNNHYISRFQLRRFLSAPPENRPGKYYTWVYNSFGEAAQKNIKEAGSQTQFYGRDSDDLENLFANKESRYGKIYADVISDPNCVAKYSDDLSDLFWIFGFRTRAMRERIRNGAVSTISRAADSVDGEFARRFFEREALRRINEKIEIRLSKMNVFERLALKKDRRFQKELGLVPSKIKKLVSDGVVGNIMREGFMEVASAMSQSDALDESHNESLQQFIEGGGRCPEKFRAKRWEVVASPNADFVLGDSGPFAISKELTEAPFVGIGEGLLEAYLPITPELCLVAMFNSLVPNLTPAQIKACTVSTSLENFFFSDEADELKQLAKEKLGSATDMLPSNEVDKIVASFWDRK